MASGTADTRRRIRTTNQNNTPLHSASSVIVARYPSAASGVKCQSATISQYSTAACAANPYQNPTRSEEHTSELQSRLHLVCRLLLEKKKKNIILIHDQDEHQHLARSA